MKITARNTRGLPLMGIPRNEIYVDRLIFYGRLKGVKKKITKNGFRDQ